MEFEFDLNKSQINKKKHGIDFIQAQELWLDNSAIQLLARTEEEPRFLVIGKIKNKLWSAIITHRNNKIRIISVRRSRKEEVAIYEKNKG